MPSSLTGTTHIPSHAEQIARDEQLARQKQIGYALSPAPVTTNHDNIHPQFRDKPLPIYTPVDFYEELIKLHDNDDIAQLANDEVLAQERQNNYTTQFQSKLRQEAQDERVAKELSVRQDRNNYMHQISVHNLRCGCNRTTEITHIFEVHNSNCACERHLIQHQ